MYVAKNMNEKAGRYVAPSAINDEPNEEPPCTHTIHRASSPCPPWRARLRPPARSASAGAPFAPIDRYAWGGDYRPEARAYLAWDDAGLRVLLCANEPTVSGKVTAFGGPVWTDSCLEFFLQPFADDPAT